MLRSLDAIQHFLKRGFTVRLDRHGLGVIAMDGAFDIREFLLSRRRFPLGLGLRLARFRTLR